MRVQEEFGNLTRSRATVALVAALDDLLSKIPTLDNFAPIEHDFLGDYSDGMENTRMRTHGVAPGETIRMLHDQKGLCALCETPITIGTADLDHDHTTGVRRAMLCGRCNNGLGHFLDDPDLLRKAAAYVEGYR